MQKYGIGQRMLQRHEELEARVSSAVESSVGGALYDGVGHGAVLAEGHEVVIRYDDGSARVLDVARWHGPARGADASVLERVVGSALDVGCGPGRMAGALALRDDAVLGIDVAPTAIGLTLQTGAPALLLDVFGEVPGRWANVLLMDGNIGIGGDPVRLLSRLADLLDADGQVVVELDAPGSGVLCGEVRLERGVEVGGWFPWARVGAEAVAELAAEAGLVVAEQWCAYDPPAASVPRWFASLVHG